MMFKSEGTNVIEKYLPIVLGKSFSKIIIWSFWIGCLWLMLKLSLILSLVLLVVSRFRIALMLLPSASTYLKNAILVEYSNED